MQIPTVTERDKGGIINHQEKTNESYLKGSGKRRKEQNERENKRGKNPTIPSSCKKNCRGVVILDLYPRKRQAGPRETGTTPEEATRGGGDFISGGKRIGKLWERGEGL